MEIEKYLERIMYHGQMKPSIDVLSALQKNHLLSIPFENLDIHYKVPIELNVENIFKKVVMQRRGGFCYELNSIFHQLLRSIGFEVKMISARVFSEKRQSFSPEFDHMAIIANVDSMDYLVDVGFGEFSFHPLAIEFDTIQNDDRGIFRIEKYDDTHYKATKRVNEKWVPEYMFTLRERQLSEFSEMCHYNQSSPESHFTQNTFCSLPTENGRITVSLSKIKITERDAVTELPVTTENDFLLALDRYFNIRLNDIQVPDVKA